MLNNTIHNTTPNDFEEYKATFKAQLAAHSFDGITFNFEKLSYALEGLVKLGKIQLAGNNIFQDYKNELSPAISQLLVQFVESVRPGSQKFCSPEGQAIYFTQLMKTLISAAKTENPHQFAAQRLLGFLLYHNFSIQFNNQHFRISDIVWAEMSLMDHFLYQHFGDKYLPFLNKECLAQQNYPGRDELERVLSFRLMAYSQPPVMHYYQLKNSSSQSSSPMEIDKPSNQHRSFLGNPFRRF